MGEFFRAGAPAMMLACCLATAAHAGDLDLRTDNITAVPETVGSNVDPDPTGLGPYSSIGDYLAHWRDRVEYAQSTQPHWMTPIATTTPRLEQEFRYDQLFETLGNGGDLYNFDGGKGLELIPTTTNEVIVNLPPRLDRTGPDAAHGWGDWPAFLIKQRLASANEDSGNYILSVFLAGQLPTGSDPFSNDSFVLTPTIAAGKGWGNFDIQATVGTAIPTQYESTIGTSLVSNVAFQYHFWKYFWPEFELNDTYWFDGGRDGKNQLFLTPGIIFGRFEIGDHEKLIFGVGYQFAVGPKTKEPLTPMYDHAVLLTARLAF